MLSLKQWQEAQQHTSTTWRLLDTGFSDGARNMAVDEAIMEACAKKLVPPTLRFYGWKPYAVSIGYFQHAQKEIDFTACHCQGIDVVRRLTGGRAVLHARELTYSIVVSEDYPGIPPSISASYRYLSQGLLAGITKLGLEAHLTMPAAAYSLHKNTPPSAACFDSPSHYELTINGRKLIGSAQVRKHGIILQHGSILLDFSSQELTSILKLSLENKLRTAAILQKRVISLHDALCRMPTYDEVRDAMEAGFTEALQIKLQAGKLTDEENATAETLRKEKYAQEQWLDKR